MADQAKYQASRPEEIRTGNLVTYTDERSVDHEALVTAVWPRGNVEPPSLNLVYVSADPDKHDDYGRQIDRDTSVVHWTSQPAEGRYWSRSMEVLSVNDRPTMAEAK